MPNGDNKSNNPIDGDGRVQVIFFFGLGGGGKIQANGEKMTHKHHEILDMLIKLCLNCINNGDNYHDYITHNQLIGKHNSFHVIHKDYRFYERIAKFNRFFYKEYFLD